MEEHVPLTFTIKTDVADVADAAEVVHVDGTELLTSSTIHPTLEKTSEILNTKCDSSIETTMIQQDPHPTPTKQLTLLHAVLKQPKIKETSLFKESNQTQKKIKLGVGFNIQRSITPELCRFMNLEAGNKTTLNDATKYIINYITNHKLQNQTARKYINLDPSLCKLFNLSDKEEDKEQPQGEKNRLTYFNLHKYIHRHFIDQP